MESTWEDSPESEDTSQPWAGSHAKPRPGLALLFANGKRRGYLYSDCEGVDWDHSMVKIYFTHATVVVVGQRLEKLALLILSYAASYIREEHKSPFKLVEGESFIERIEIKPPNTEALARKP
jgi:hypothetical protein